MSNATKHHIQRLFLAMLESVGGLEGRRTIKMTNLKRQTKLAVKKWAFKWPSSELGDIDHILPYFNSFSGNFMTNVGYNFSRWADIKSVSNASVFTRFKLSD